VITGTKDLRNRDATHLGRLGELRVLEKAVTEGVVLTARVIAEGSRHQANDRFDDAQGREFSAGEYEVTEGYLVVDREIEGALVEALVASAE
jgi:hypothetical protein